MVREISPEEENLLKATRLSEHLRFYELKNEATCPGKHVSEKYQEIDGLINLLTYYSKKCVLKTSPSA